MKSAPVAPSAPNPQAAQLGASVTRISLLLVLASGSALRLYDLGGRSLWLDEFSTWHVAQLPLWESLTWPAELTPPMYSLVVRALSWQDRPPEWLLRLPAAIAGIASIAAIWQLARIVGDRAFAFSAALLLAILPLQIEYSREARPYSFFVLFCTLSTSAWLTLCRCESRRRVALYSVLTIAAIYSHALAWLMVGGHLLSWALLAALRRRAFAMRSVTIAFIFVVAGSTPLLLRTIAFRDAVRAGLSWIEPVSIGRALRILGALCPGGEPDWGLRWLACGAAILLTLSCSALVRRAQRNETRKRSNSSASDREINRKVGTSHHAATDALVVLGAWVAASFGGLCATSWLAQPLLVERFALPASVPLILLSLMLLARIHRHAPLVAALFWLTLTADRPPRFISPPPPGFRELVAYVDHVGNPSTDVAALCMIGETPAAQEYERLGADYYKLKRLQLHEFPLGQTGAAQRDALLRDSRRTFLIVFQGDPEPEFAREGRLIEAFPTVGGDLRLLYFQPYRLIRIAPLGSRAD